MNLKLHPAWGPKASKGRAESPLAASAGAQSLASTSHVGVLDGLRVLCVLMVAFFHVWQQSWLTPSIPFIGSLEVVVRGGYIFVDGLILLSGFLLFLPYAKHRVEGSSLPRPGAFYMKRVARIVPSYVFCLLVMLLAVAIPQHKYASTGAMLKDLFMHLTFVHTLSWETYMNTPLNGALWTLGVEVQAYLFFPLIARALLKKPLWTYALLTLAGLAFRVLAGTFAPDTSMYFNQLPAFLDVYALGMLAAWGYVALANRRLPTGKAIALRIAATALAAAAAYAIFLLMKNQARANGYDAIRLCQMNQRLPLAFALTTLMLGLSFSFRGIRFLFSNALMRCLSAISFNYYIWHQVLAVWLKQWHIPPYSSASPNQAGEQPWQTLYTLICFGAAILAATAVTYGLEKPAAALIQKIFRRSKTHERPTQDTIGA